MIEFLPSSSIFRKSFSIFKWDTKIRGYGQKNEIGFFETADDFWKEYYLFLLWERDKKTETLLWENWETRKNSPQYINWIRLLQECFFPFSSFFHIFLYFLFENFQWVKIKMMANKLISTAKNIKS